MAPIKSTDISNTGLGRFLSVEILGSMLMTAMAMGILYATITNNVRANQEDVAELRGQQASMVENVRAIETEVIKIRSTQQHFAEDIVEIKGDIKDVKALLLEISRDQDRRRTQ